MVILAKECEGECEFPKDNCGGRSMPSPCGSCCECMGCILPIYGVPSSDD